MKKIAILGSTGSIGRSALDVISGHRDKFKVVGITGNKNIDLLIEQIETYDPEYISIGFLKGQEVLKKKYPNKKIYLGNEGLKKVGALKEIDILLTAVSGNIGIEGTIEGIKNGKRIALANKETLVCAGDLIKKMVKEYGAEIIPVDSEHSALFQSMESGSDREVKKLIITASGGPFRGKKVKDLVDVSVEDALNHPNWAMGSKITIDSSTLVNKGLEVIEAHYLFDVPYEDIEVVVHPQSVIHSLVEFTDRSVISQLGVPDMKIPIQYSFTYPKREENLKTKELNLVEYGKLTFEEPDLETFKGLALAFKAGKIGKTMPLVYNTANEVAVDLFFNKKIKFLEIYKIIEDAMDNHQIEEVASIERIREIDKELREEIYRKY